jgi:uncharacterized phiE125 gp8 family phage protein
MTLRLITPPAVEPVSVETAKLFLRVDGIDEDTLITSLVKGARETGEELARSAFITQTLEMIVDNWPPKFVLALMRPPLQSVTSVKYYDENNVEAIWTDYTVDTRNEPGRIHFNSTPGTTLLESGGIVVRYVAGYGNTEADVPQRIKDAILALTAYRYENRESQDIPTDIKRAFMAERAVWF